jgi:tRNA threonylcarbamoyladenosine biosynthesis protein TsaE
VSIWLADEDATLRAGAALAHALDESRRSAAGARENDVTHATSGCHVHLHGGLGAGKTTFVRGMLRAMGVVGAVKSPTYTLVEPYQTAHREVFHFDLYRLNDPEELELLGARDYFRSDALCVFEWPSRGRGALPEPLLIFDLQAQADGRLLRIESSGANGEALRICLNEQLQT